MLRSACLATALLVLATPVLACGARPHSGPTGPRPASCALEALAGDWIGEEGKRMRVLAPGEGAPHWRAVSVTADGTAGGTVYSNVRLAQGCSFFARRHVDLNDRVHPAPPHAVILTLDPGAGQVEDDYRYGDSLHWRRATTK